MIGQDYANPSLTYKNLCEQGVDSQTDMQHNMVNTRNRKRKTKYDQMCGVGQSCGVYNHYGLSTSEEAGSSMNVQSSGILSRGSMYLNNNPGAPHGVGGISGLNFAHVNNVIVDDQN